MEHLLPDSSENIIVGVLYQKIFTWYITDKEIWFLDYKKRIAAFKERGLEVKEKYVDEERQGLLILNSENVNIFLERINKYKINSKRLKDLLLKSRISEDESWLYDFRPSLYVNFDNHQLFSLYSEPASYESYVPENWEGKYFDFTKLIPNEEQYWISENSKDLLKKESV